MTNTISLKIAFDGLRKAAAVSTIVGAAAVSHALSVTYSTPLLASTGNQTQNGTLPKFNTGLGTLTKVEITFDNSAFTASEITDLSLNSEQVSRSSTSSSMGSLDTGVVGYTYGNTVTASTSFSGVIGAGTTNSGTDTQGSPIVSDYTDAGTLAAFTGPGTVAAGNSTSASSSIFSYGPSFSDAEALLTTQSSVTYFYTTTPGPAAAGTMLLGMAGALVRRRRGR